MARKGPTAFAVVLALVLLNGASGGRAAETVCQLDSSFAPQLAVMQRTLARRGTAWNTVRGGIRQYILTEALATGFSAHRVIATMQRVLNDGRTLHDTKVIASVCNQVARAHSVDPETVAKALFAAFNNGQNDALIGLDPHLAPLIAQHAHLKSVLDRLRDDTVDAIQRTDDAALNYDRAKVLRELQCPDAS